jgi:hypothetical protein
MEFRNNRMIFMTICNLCSPHKSVEKFYGELLELFSTETIVSELEKNITTPVPEFLMGGAIFLKKIGDTKRAVKFLETFSKLEYGIASHEMLQNLKNSLSGTETDNITQKVLIVTNSPVLQNEIMKSLEGDIDVGFCQSRTERMIKGKISEFMPDVVIIDDSDSSETGKDIVFNLNKSFNREIKFILMGNSISEEVEEELKENSIGFILPPSMGGNLQKALETIFEKIKRERIIVKQNLY